MEHLSALSEFLGVGVISDIGVQKWPITQVVDLWATEDRVTICLQLYFAASYALGRKWSV